MSSILSRDTNTVTVANFWENYLLKKYNFEPPYQRKSIWSDEKQSFFIDSILKNFPMPPIFLHQQIDDATGKTKYDVIDGKQRLNSIIRFINNEIPASEESADGPFYIEEIAGVYFQELDKEELNEYKRKFWRYVIPIEYIDTSDPLVIDAIFDRLNRNGEPLNGQELRKSIYHGKPLLLLVERCAELPFWKERLKDTDVNRMEHYEFVSELIFQQIENKPLHANPLILDQLYEKYSTEQVDWEEVESEFIEITSFLESLDIAFDRLKVGGVSHLYGLWCLSNYCYRNQLLIEGIGVKLNAFFEQLRSSNVTSTLVEIYKKSMSSRTKDEGQRRRRLEALKQVLGV